MVSLRSVSGRIMIGKIIGLIIGFICLAVLPGFGFPIFSYFGMGTLLMFMLMGTMIGFVGQFDRHPVLDFKMSWCVRGLLVGVAFTLMYVLLAYPAIAFILQSSLLSWMGLSSPFWALIDGAVIGMVMAYAETRLCGEGKNLPLV